jgi:outer membrane receptor protein involved in Fe transport
MRGFLITTALLASTLALAAETLPSAPGQPVEVFGTVVDPDNRPVEEARVELGRVHATTDDQGRFTLKNVLPGNYRMRVRHRGYETADEPVEVLEGLDLSVTVALARTSEKLHLERPVALTAHPIQREEIQRIPGSNGDAFRVLQNLPGVARNSFGVGPLVIRGGSGWDTRVYVDDAQISQLFHFFGLYATFNSDLLEDITLLPGSFGVAHGRSIGGLVLASTRTPGEDGSHGHVDLNIVDVNALYEAPLGKDWSIAIAGRRSYVDTWLPHVIPADALQFTLAPRYYDYQLRAEHKTPETRTFFELFGSNDRVGLVVPNPAADPEGHATFDSYVLYNRLSGHDERPALGARLLSEASVGFDRSEFAVGEDLFFRIDTFPLSWREQLTRRFGRFALSVGSDLFAFPYKIDAQVPPRPQPGAFANPLVSRDLEELALRGFAFEPALYTELRWLPIDRLELVAGLRADYESYMHKGWLDPRLSALLQLTPDVKLKAAAGLYHQPPNYQQGLLTKEFGNPDLLPEAASQYSIGVEAFPWHLVRMNLDLYDEELFHLAEATNAPAPGQPPPPLYLSNGVGRSYGLELLLRRDFGEHFFGWLSYSLSRAERTAAGHTGLQQSRYDQPQHLVAVASWKFSSGWTLGVRLQWVSGPLTTPYTGAVFDANAGRYQPIPGAPFSQRLPAFFQLDTRVDKKWQFQRWALTAYLDLQNVTNRQNVEGTSYNFDYSQRGDAHGLPIFPILGLRADF